MFPNVILALIGLITAVFWVALGSIVLGITSPIGLGLMALLSLPGMILASTVMINSL